MRYTSFSFKNFRGIKDTKLKLDTTPTLNIFTLVGLNESGKTSILEAINFFQSFTKVDKDKLIPKDQKLNFNGEVTVSAELEFDSKDEARVKEFLKNQDFLLQEDIGRVKITRKIKYTNSKPDAKQVHSSWSISLVGYGKSSRKKIAANLSDQNRQLWQDVTTFMEKELFPKIIFYANFLFEVPSKIYLANINPDEATTPKYLLRVDDQYYRLIQDILDSLNQGLDVNTHLVQRYISGGANDIDNINHVLNAMSAKITEEVFQTWGQVSGISVQGREVTFGDSVKEDPNGYYLELKIKEGTKAYLVNERSLGFRWFFAFLLFTQFRKFRKNDPKNTLFLLDEPASNLHQTGQQELLTLLNSLTDKSSVIYSTHSHHLISPKWLAGAYIVKNAAVNPDAKSISSGLSVRSTDITVDKYFNFVSQNPDQETHFKPILDVLDYRPSKLELVPNIVVLEGKFDFYNFNYMKLCLEEKQFNFYPGSGVDKLDSIIALYLAWGANFILLLDADKAGKKALSRYKKDFGIAVDNRIFTLADVDPKFDDFTTENLTTDTDKQALMKDTYGSDEPWTKSVFNVAIQQRFIDDTTFKFSTQTAENFSAIFKFLEKHKM